MKTIIGITASLLTLFIAGGEVPLKPPRLELFGASIDHRSEVTVSFDESHIRIGIETPNTARPFWGTSPHARPPLRHLWSRFPALALVRNLGMPDELRFIVQPKNLAKIIQPVSFKQNLVIPLNMGDKEVGEVTLFAKDGDVNTHKAVFTIDRDSCRQLGENFMLLSGDPFARRITNEAQQDGAEQPATAPESKPEGKEKPKPESEGRSQ